MSEREDDFAAIRKALNQAHDPAVFDAAEHALDRIQAHGEALEESAQRWMAAHDAAVASYKVQVEALERDKVERRKLHERELADMMQAGIDSQRDAVEALEGERDQLREALAQLRDFMGSHGRLTDDQRGYVLRKMGAALAGDRYDPTSTERNSETQDGHNGSIGESDPPTTGIRCQMCAYYLLSRGKRCPDHSPTVPTGTTDHVIPGLESAFDD